jgi:hypothetical protein
MNASGNWRWIEEVDAEEQILGRELPAPLGFGAAGETAPR